MCLSNPRPPWIYRPSRRMCRCVDIQPSRMWCHQNGYAPRIGGGVHSTHLTDSARGSDVSVKGCVSPHVCRLYVHVCVMTVTHRMVHRPEWTWKPVFATLGKNTLTWRSRLEAMAPCCICVRCWPMAHFLFNLHIWLLTNFVVCLSYMRVSITGSLFPLTAPPTVSFFCGSLSFLSPHPPSLHQQVRMSHHHAHIHFD